MGLAQHVLANADLGMSRWPDPAAEFSTVSGSTSTRVHTDPKCPALRRAKAVTTTSRTWGQAARDLHKCPGSNVPLDDVGYQRHQLNTWLRTTADRAAARIDRQPVRPDDLTALFRELENIDLLVTDTDARASITLAWDLTFALAAVATGANDPLEGKVMAAAADWLTPLGPHGVPRRPGTWGLHVDGQGTVLRSGWDTLRRNLYAGVPAARDACLALWAQCTLQAPTLTQLGHARVTAEPGRSVVLKDLSRAWRSLFLEEATELLDFWIEQVQDRAAEYAHLPPFYLEGTNADHLQGVWPGVPGRGRTVEVPALVAIACSGYDPLHALVESPAWPAALLNLAAETADATDATWAQALTAAAGITA